MTDTILKTPKGRISFPYVFEGRENQQGKLEYSTDLIFDKEADLSGMLATVEKAKEKEWGSKRPNNITSPFKDGTLKNDTPDKFGETGKYPEYVGATYITLKSKKPIAVVDINRKAITKEELNAGCYARAVYSAFAYDFAGKIGVTLYLQALQKLAEGEFDTSVDIEEAFAEETFTTAYADQKSAPKTDNSNLLKG
tara:strand:- start:162 stop:749 length:588 start_codon:yes stop_codon:yes gene_type:complete